MKSRGKRAKSSKKNDLLLSLATMGAKAATEHAAQKKRAKRERERERERDRQAFRREQERERELERRELDRQTKEVEGHFNRGKIYFADGEYDKALQEFTQTLSLDANHPAAYAMRGIIYTKNLNPDGAIFNFSKAIELNHPTLDAVYESRGLIYIAIGEYEQAIQDFNRVIEISPDDAEAYNNRGVAYKHTGEYVKAIEDFDRAIALKPDFPLAINNRKDVQDQMLKSTVFVSSALERLASLHERGILTDEEFKIQKMKLLDG